VNAGTAKFCQQCGSPLDVKTALELDEQRNNADELLTTILKKRPEIGKILAKAIIEMGLKDKL
jgi:hypothetical protein